MQLYVRITGCSAYYMSIATLVLIIDIYRHSGAHRLIFIVDSFYIKLCLEYDANRAISLAR